MTTQAHGARVQRMFDRIAPGYDRANRLMSLGTDRSWRRRAVADMLPPTAARPRVLDLCAGTLDVTLEILRAHPEARVVAGDFAPQMLERGRAKLPVDAPVELQVMDAHALPVETAQLDAVLCAFGIRNLADLPRATAEQARCLRPGGRLTVLEFFRPQGRTTRLIHNIYNRTVVPIVGWMATGDREAYRYLPASIGEFETVDNYADLLREFGFTDVEATPLTFGVAWIVRATRSGAAA